MKPAYVNCGTGDMCAIEILTFSVVSRPVLWTRIRFCISLWPSVQRILAMK